MQPPSHPPRDPRKIRPSPIAHPTAPHSEPMWHNSTTLPCSSSQRERNPRPQHPHSQPSQRATSAHSLCSCCGRTASWCRNGLDPLPLVTDGIGTTIVLQRTAPLTQCPRRWHTRCIAPSTCCLLPALRCLLAYLTQPHSQSNEARRSQ